MAYFIVQSAANMEGRYTQHPSSEAGRSHITLYHLLTHTHNRLLSNYLTKQFSVVVTGNWKMQ